MRSRSVVLAVAVTALCAAGAVACYLRATRLRSEGEWHLARANAQGQEYATTLDSAVAESQLATFEQRRLVLEQAHQWQRLQYLLVLTSVVSALASGLLYVFYRLRLQLAEASDEVSSGSDLPPA